MESDTPDILLRLRGVQHNILADMTREAADEIERLREELTASHESHGNEVGSLTERLSLAIHERDEARREICSDQALRRFAIGHEVRTEKGVAAERGWDCFAKKEGGCA